MTLRRLTLSNMRGLWRKYAAFFLSSTLAVILFYLLASFVMHPDVVNGYVSQAERVRRGLLVSQYIVVTFSFLFVLYSSSAFIRARKKEFGLFSLIGATKQQLSRMVITEHAWIGVTSAAVGLGLGIPLSKSMLDAMSKVLQVTSPIRFMVVVPALTMTALLFVALFIIIGSLTTLQISPRKVVGLLREHQRPKTLPRYSWFVALLSLLFIGTGYGVAWVVNGQNIVPAMLPVTGIVSVGTYLFFAQASVGILRTLQKRVSYLYRNLNLLTTGDLVFRMKENAWVLATVAVLSAAVITTTGTIYTAQATLLRDEERAHPHALTFLVSGGASPSELASDIRKTISEDRVTIREEVVLSGLIAAAGGMESALVVPEKSLNEWAGTSGQRKMALEGTEAALLLPFVGPTAEAGTERFPIDITHNDETFSVNSMPWSFPHTNHLYSVEQFLVVDDALFAKMVAETPGEDQAAFFSYEFENWRKALKTTEHVRSVLANTNIVELVSRMEDYEARKQITSLTAMIALFVTALFFIASGSMLYFRLFGEIEEDREKYKMMGKLGVSRQEIHQVVTRQLLVFFFAPIVVGSLHCGFAMKALSNLLRMMDWPFLGVFRYALAAIGGFSLVQIVYFMVARHAYVREVFDGARA